MASGWDPRTPPAHPPADPEQRRVIEKLAEFRARNGADFESVVRAKQAGNPQYAFLSREGPEAAYYRRCLANLGVTEHPHPNPPGAPVAVPPPPPHPGLHHLPRPHPHPHPHLHPPPPPPPHLRRDLPPPPGLVPPPGPQNPPESDPTFPAGLLPALVRAANASHVGAYAYAPVDASRVPAAEAAANRAAASLDAAYLDERLRRFAEDLKDGGRSRRHRHEIERASADAAIRERHREAMERAKGVDYGGEADEGPIAKTWRGAGGGGGGGGGGRRDGGERMGLGANRAEEEATAGDAYLQFRKQRSGTYHNVSRAWRSGRG